MSSLKGKHIVLGITGSIAAYKSAVLARLLVKRGAQVQVIMTPAAKEFIAPLTLSTLTGNTVISEFFNERTGDWNSHVNLGLWAHYFLVAPVTATTLSKMAYGIADNMLLTSYLSTRGKTVVAPAMDLDMYAHPATQTALDILRQRGVQVVEPAEGELASHLIGKGRMAEPEQIVEFLERLAAQETGALPLKGKNVLLTSGPTYERIDPVRFIGNFSTGKMGKAIAEVFARAGAQVRMVSGPTHLLPNNSNVEVMPVESAMQMLEACHKQADWYDIAIFCAAVADYRPAESANTKIKRENTANMALQLVQNPDIAATMARYKQEKTQRLHVGFALETNATPTQIMEKMKRKGLDMIVHNSLADPGAGFGTDTNKVTLYTCNANPIHLPTKSKEAVAQDLLQAVLALLTPSSVPH